MNSTNKGSIPVSKEHGVNPCIEICAHCGKDTGNLLLAGKTNEYWCRDCKVNVYSQKPSCPRAGKGERHDVELKRSDVEMPHKIQSGALCDDCTKKSEEHDKVIADGGVAFGCKDCHISGVIKASAPLAAAVRKQLGIAAPKPCGVEFDKNNCPKCGPNPVEEDDGKKEEDQG